MSTDNACIEVCCLIDTTQISTRACGDDVSKTSRWGPFSLTRCSMPFCTRMHMSTSTPYRVTAACHIIRTRLDQPLLTTGPASLLCVQAQVGNRWSVVAKHINGRTGQQCAQRWRHKVRHNSDECVLSSTRELRMAVNNQCMCAGTQQSE